MNESADRLLSPKESMKIAGIRSASTFYQLVKSGELPPLIKRGRSSFHLASEIDAYVQRLANARTQTSARAANASLPTARHGITDAA